MSEKVEWFEVWFDYSARGEYLLVLESYGVGLLKILDPQKKREVVGTFSTYEEAGYWFANDEFTRVEGRFIVDY
jgi:hypothetical protein